MNDITARTIAAIASRSTLNADEITLKTPLDEIGVDSLGLTEIVMDLEDLFGVSVDLNAAEAWDSLKSVGDVVNAIAALVRAKS